MSLDLNKLFLDVFAPNDAESVLFIVDVPNATPDDEEWKARRAMADRWHSAMEALAKRIGFSVFPIAEFNDVGQHNNSLPDVLHVEGDWIKADTLISTASLVIAMTKWSATAPLHGWVNHYKNLRAASLPGITPAMEKTALAADYAEVAKYCRILQPRLDAAELAFVRFSTGDELCLDLRWRKPLMDDGILHPENSGKVINLPSGEVFSTLYEGERKEFESRTQGTLPVFWKNEIVRLVIDRNTVTEIAAPADNDLRTFLEEDFARKNVAELGLGCNPHAAVTGNILEDEKAGPHIALGRSDHMGGMVGPHQFQLEPWHQDFAYTRKCPIFIKAMTFTRGATEAETIVTDGRYARHLGIPM